MQDKDFDRFIQQAFENQPEPEYNPADWDKLEDRLHNLNAAQPNAAGTSSAGAGLGKLGLVASAILVTALNVVFLAKPELVKNAVNTEEKVAVAQKTQETEILAEAANEIAADNTQAKEINTQIASEPAAAAAQNQVSEMLPVITPENGSQNLAVVKAATSFKKQARGTAATKNRNADASIWAWPSVATNRPGSFNNGNQGLMAGKPESIAEPCNPTFKPEIATVLIGKDTLYNNRVAISTCQLLEARIFTKGAPADKINLTSNIAKVLPGARFVTEPGSNTALVQWQPAPEMARQQPYNVTFWVADVNCADAKPVAYQMAVQVNPAFKATFNGLSRIGKGQETTLEVKGAPLGSTYQWVTGNKIVAENETGRFVTAPATTTTYRVVVTAPTGCVLADSLRVEVAPENRAEVKVVIPNIFTPNNDGLNDYFEVQLPEEGPYSLEVFDRDGKQVYAQNKYNNKWNATKLASGTYFYIITTPRENKTYKGWVEILR